MSAERPRSFRNSQPERVCPLEEQCGLGCYIGRPGDGWNDFSFVRVKLEAALEDCAENPLLPPDFARLQMAIGGETSHLGACTRSAWRAVVCLAGTENKIAALVGRVMRTGEELDVVDLRAIRATDPGLDDSTANGPGER